MSPTDRQTERRALLVRAAFELFGDGGETAVSVRSVCREAGLTTRYFYESFTDTAELLGAVYGEVAADLGQVLTATMGDAPNDDRARLTAGIRAVLDFSSTDPRRGKILFTEARTNPVLAARRTMAQDNLRELVLSEGRRTSPETNSVATEVGAAMYAGAMAELARQWLAGTLGDDLAAVVNQAVALLVPG